MKKVVGLILIVAIIYAVVRAVTFFTAYKQVNDVIDDAKKSAYKSDAYIVVSRINNYCSTEALKIQMGEVTSEEAKCKDGSISKETLSVMLINGLNEATITVALKDNEVSEFEYTYKNYKLKLENGTIVEAN